MGMTYNISDNTEDPNYKTFAFISYSHRDMRMAKWLQRRLENYRLPSEVHNDIDARDRYLRPVFRDQSDLNTGVLGDELRKHLKESKYLIIICSENSAQSQWVSDEAKAFVEMGRLDRIIPVIIPDGQTPENELFPIFLREYFNENPDKELLGINVGEVGKAKALIRVVSRMLDVSFDTLWQRHKRVQRVRQVSIAATGMVALVLAYLFMVPVRVNINITPQKSNLPNGGTVSVRINGSEYTTDMRNPQIDGIQLPGYKRLDDILLEVESKYFNPVDTTVDVGAGFTRDIEINLYRDDTFATYSGAVYDPEMKPIENVTVEVANHRDLTDRNGEFSISIPLALQKTEMPILLEKEGYMTLIRVDESPGKELKYILHK